MTLTGYMGFFIMGGIVWRYSNNSNPGYGIGMDNPGCGIGMVNPGLE